MKYTDDGRAQAVDLIMFAGQSNMSGRGNAAEAVICDSFAGYEYKAVSNPGELVPVREPFGLGEDKGGALSDCIPGVEGGTMRSGSMVSAVIDTYYIQTGRKIVGVSASKGGSNTVQWKQVYLADAVERLERAKAFLAENNILIKRTYVVWCQGESDGDAKRTAEDYITNTRDIFEVLRNHGAEKCFLVQIGHYNYIDYPGVADGLTGKEWDMHYETIRNAQAELCRMDDNFILSGSFEPYIHEMKDTYHYNQNAYNAVGRTVGGTMADYVLTCRH